MKTIAIISQKGGAGKTTLAINLAGAAESARLSTLIVDLDPQASSHTWSELREHIRGEKTSPIVICTISKLLPQVLAAARKDGADLAIIDTAPHSETSALDAAKAADLVLIPCRASMVDLKAVENSVDIVRLAKTPAVMFLINCVRPGDRNLPNEAEIALARHSIPVCPLRLTLRSDCVHAFSAGQSITEFAPDSAAAQEIRELLKMAFRRCFASLRYQGEQMTSHLEQETVA